MTMTPILDKNHLTEAGMRLALNRIAHTLTVDRLEQRAESVRWCLSDVADYTHREHRERGWWTNLQTGEPLQRNVGELLMLTTSELAEIPYGPEALTTMDDKLPERLMTEVELADCAIRIFDTCGAIAHSFWYGFIAAARETGKDSLPLVVPLDIMLMQTVRCLALAMEGHRKKVVLDAYDGQHIPQFDYELGRALHWLFVIGESQALKVADAIIEKLKFNAQREDHKLENRKGENGKKY